MHKHENKKRKRKKWNHRRTFPHDNKSTHFKLYANKMQFKIVNCLQPNNDLNVVILYDNDENFNKKICG